MNNPDANTTDPPKRGLRARAAAPPEQEREFLIAAVAATHDLLIMNSRPDLAPEFLPARMALRPAPLRRHGP